MSKFEGNESSRTSQIVSREALIKEFYTTADIAQATGRSIRSILREAEKKRWSFIHGETTEKGGRPPKLFEFRALPSAVRLALVEMERKKMDLSVTLPSPETLLGDLKEGIDPPATVPTPSLEPALSPMQREKALAKADLVRFYLEYLESKPRGQKGRARVDFEKAYNGGAYPQILALLGKRSWKALETWKRELRLSRDPFQLADRRGAHRRGKTDITEETGRLLWACALNQNAPDNDKRPLLSEAIRMFKLIMELRGTPCYLSDTTYRNYILHRKSLNYDEWCFYRGGEKALRERALPFLEKDFDAIEVADVLVADGHVLNETIEDPFTGKDCRQVVVGFVDLKSNYCPGYAIGRTENTKLITAALYRTILGLGKIPKVVIFDNGKAFRSKFLNGRDLKQSGIEGLLLRLGIRVIFTGSYRSQSKGMGERFWGYMGEYERRSPSYVGGSVETKPARLKRGEKLLRGAWNKYTGGRSLTMEQALCGFASGLDEYHARPQDGHLAGKCPAEVFEPGRGPGVDPEQLRFLMMEVEVRRIYRNGIRFLGRYYFHPALYGRKHPTIIRYDLHDLNAIYVYDRQNTFICEARPTRKIHPAANYLGTEEDRAVFKEELTRQATLRKKTLGPARKFLEEHIIPEHHRQLEAAGVFELGPPRQRSSSEMPQEVLDPEEVRREVEELEALGLPIIDEYWSGIVKFEDPERYERIVEAEVQGMEIPKDERTFARIFEQSEYFDLHQGYFERKRQAMEEAFGGKREEVTA